MSGAQSSRVRSKIFIEPLPSHLGRVTLARDEKRASDSSTPRLDPGFDKKYYARARSDFDFACVPDLTIDFPRSRLAHDLSAHHQR